MYVRAKEFCFALVLLEPPDCKLSLLLSPLIVMCSSVLQRVNRKKPATKWKAGCMRLHSVSTISTQHPAYQLILAKKYQEAKRYLEGVSVPSTDDFRAELLLCRDLKDVNAADAVMKRMERNASPRIYEYPPVGRHSLPAAPFAFLLNSRCL